MVKTGAIGLGDIEEYLPAGLDATEIQSFLSLVQSYIYYQEQSFELSQQLVEEQEKLLALEKQRNDLAFLQDQLKLLDLIADYDLDKGILEGLELGIEADAELVMAAMVEAMQDMIAAAETELGIESPSKVFQGIGQRMMEGIALGVTGAAYLPAMAVAGASQATTHNWNLTVNESGGVTDPARSFQYLQALVGA